MAPEPEQLQQQQQPAWMVLDRKATFALKVAQDLVSSYQLEMAKIASDALGPTDPEEKQAMVDGWMMMGKAQNMYVQAATYLDDSQKNLKDTLKEMELQMKQVEEKDQEACRACIKQIKGFKKNQKEKLEEVHAQIGRIQPSFDAALEVLEKVAKEKGCTVEDVIEETTEMAKEAKRDGDNPTTAEECEEPVPAEECEEPVPAAGKKGKKKRGKK